MSWSCRVCWAGVSPRPIVHAGLESAGGWAGPKGWAGTEVSGRAANTSAGRGRRLAQTGQWPGGTIVLPKLLPRFRRGRPSEEKCSIGT